MCGPNPVCHLKHRHAKRQLFYTNMVSAKNILPKKVRKLRQNKFATKQSKRPKRPKLGKKMPTSNIKFQNLPKNATKKRKIATQRKT